MSDLVAWTSVGHVERIKVSSSGGTSLYQVTIHVDVDAVLLAGVKILEFSEDLRFTIHVLLKELDYSASLVSLFWVKNANALPSRVEGVCLSLINMLAVVNFTHSEGKPDGCEQNFVCHFTILYL